MSKSPKSRVTDPTLEFLKGAMLAITRENYLAVGYLGNPPEELDAESSTEMIAFLNAFAEAEFISRISLEDRRLLKNMQILIEEPHEVE
jgi:hypothetical protein